MNKGIKYFLYVLIGIVLLVILIGLGGFLYLRANIFSFETEKNPIHIDQLDDNGYTYYDRNNNGQLDVYEDSRRSTEDRVADLLSQMTTEEKIHILKGSGLASAIGMVNEDEGGIPGVVGTIVPTARLGLPAINLSDGPAGLRIESHRENDESTYFCTAFPIGSLLSSTWNKELVNQVGYAMGTEAKEYGIDVILGPGANIHRHPLCGRNFEYYSEDPVLTGDIGAAMVNGIESNGIGTAVKHFVANNQETNRNRNSVEVSERAMREIYLKGFERIVKQSQPWSLMSSYNKVNGTYVPESHYYLTEVLRDEWGFEGLVMTDWFGGDNAKAMIKAGNDLLEPGTNNQWKALKKAAKNEDLSSADIDKSAARILKMIIESKKMQGYEYSNQPDLKAHAMITRQSASEGLVLLKNEAALPIAGTPTVGLIGMSSFNFIAGGTGSGDVNEKYIISLDQGITNVGLKINEEAQSIFDRHKEAHKEEFKQKDAIQTMLNPNQPPEISYTPEQIENISKGSDLAIITIGRNSGEGGDRVEQDDFLLTATEQELIKQTCEIFHRQDKKVIVVLNIGGVIETASWRDLPDAILLAWQGGQEGGNAVADVLTGRVNPSGKLPMTFPIHLNDHASNANFPLDGSKMDPIQMLIDQIIEPNDADIKNVGYTDYAEGIYVGYRHFDKQHMTVSYPFGYGLSYSEFALSDYTVKITDDTISVQLIVSNTGKVVGKEVVQVYSAMPESKIDRPINELRSFEKTKLLAPGESQQLKLTFLKSDLAYWDEQKDSWVIEPGQYLIKAGRSSRDLEMSDTISIL